MRNGAEAKVAPVGIWRIFVQPSITTPRKAIIAVPCVLFYPKRAKPATDG